MRPQVLLPNTLLLKPKTVFHVIDPRSILDEAFDHDAREQVAGLLYFGANGEADGDDARLGGAEGGFRAGSEEVHVLTRARRLVGG